MSAEDRARSRELRLLARLIEAEHRLEKCRGTLRGIKRHYGKAEASVAKSLAEACLKEVFGE